MKKTPAPAHPDEQRRWLPVAALFTVLAPVAVWLGRASSYLPRLPLWFILAYVLPLAMVAAVWIPPRTQAQRRRRVAWARAGCVLAFLYPHAYVVTVLVLWALTAG
ncbi:hypothetical protein [Streptomyces sp. NPDC096339]|uniref:hypothetical protein n=1 Tax=Streptomyces sp. NPDC096339 TaxID=3366086 RepID=UPI0037FB2052